MERNTSQRRAIRDAFEKADRPIGPAEALRAAKPHAKGLGIATVYRAINALVRDQWLVPVELPGEPPRYELAKKLHHHHFHCRSCGRVYDIKGCPGDFKSLTPPGYQVEDHEVVLYGRCPVCAKGKKKAPVPNGQD